METKGVTCKIPLELHNRISEEIRETESTMSKFIEMIIQSGKDSQQDTEGGQAGRQKHQDRTEIR